MLRGGAGIWWRSARGGNRQELGACAVEKCSIDDDSVTSHLCQHATKSTELARSAFARLVPFQLVGALQWGIRDHEFPSPVQPFVSLRGFTGVSSLQQQEQQRRQRVAESLQGNSWQWRSHTTGGQYEAKQQQTAYCQSLANDSVSIAEPRRMTVTDQEQELTIGSVANKQMRKKLRKLVDSMHEHLEKGEAEQALHLFDPKLASQIDALEATQYYDVAILAAARLGDASLALGILNTMQACNRRVGYNALGSTLRAVAHDKGSQEGMQFLMHAIPEHQLNTAMCNTVLSSCVHHKDDETFEQCIRHMQAMGIKWDAHTWSTLMGRQVSCKTGILARLDKLWEEFQVSPVALDLASALQVRAAFVTALVKDSQLDKALQELYELLAQWRLLAGERHQLYPQLSEHGGTFTSVQKELEILIGLDQEAFVEGHISGTCGSGSKQDVSDSPVDIQAPDSRTSKHEAAAFRDLGRRVQVLSHMVMNAAERAGRYGDALRVAQTILQSVKANEYFYTFMLRLSSKHGLPPATLRKLIAEMEAQGLKLTTHVFTPLLQAHAAAADFLGCQAAIAEMKLKGVQPNQFVYNALLTSMNSHWDPDTAMAVYREMEEDGCQPDSYTYRILFQGIIYGLPNPNQNYEERDDTHKRRSKHERVLKVEKAKEYLAYWGSLAHSFGYLSNPLVLARYIQALGKTEQIHEMLRMLEPVWDRVRASQDFRVPLAALNELCRLPRLDEALSLAERLKAEGFTPDVSTYITLINGCAMSKNVVQARALLAEMRKKGLKESTVVFNVMIKAEGMGGTLEGALDVLDEMEGMPGCEPNEKTWGTLKQTARTMGRHDLLALIHEREGGLTSERFRDLRNRRLATVGAGFGDESDDDMLGF